MSVIFLTGVHGVGKGFLGAPAAMLLGLDHCTASQLIREEKGHATWGVHKRVAEIDDNQLALIRAVSRRREAGQDILLDGHFVLRDTFGKLVRLGKDIFANLQLSGVILLTESAQIIAERLVGRDGIAKNPELIAELASEVHAHVNNVCDELNIPMIAIHSANTMILAEAIGEMLQK
jgi:adenylate kinase